jgi:hypothetical protein
MHRMEVSLPDAATTDGVAWVIVGAADEDFQRFRQLPARILLVSLQPTFFLQRNLRVVSTCSHARP